MDLKTVIYDVNERIATISLNRSHRLNAWTGRMHTEYRSTFHRSPRPILAIPPPAKNS